MFNGFFFGLGFFVALLVVLIFALLIGSLAKKGNTKFSLEAFQKYARKLRDEEKYEELQVVKSIVVAMQDGEKPNNKLLEPYEMKTESKLKVKGSSISIKKEEYIVRKPSSNKKKN